MTFKNLKIIGYFAVGIMVLNVILFSFRVIGWEIFWAIILLGAVFVYVVLPKLK
jgi:hypothetical protein